MVQVSLVKHINASLRILEDSEFKVGGSRSGISNTAKARLVNVLSFVDQEAKIKDTM